MNKIKEIRLMREQSQAEVARAIGLTQQSYQRYEIDGSSPSGEILTKLAKHYGVSVDYLLGRETAVDPTVEVITDRDFAVIHRAYKKATVKDKEKLKALLAFAFDISFSEGESDD